ncbi:MAG TPA: Hsp20/alpha crystallin family protein [Urbifossiella sp.]|jgi:HSP20 family protein|nr:Hsp20/alpha crystallin family protein [Urbifossiella sp.]
MNRVRNPFNALFNEVNTVQEEFSRLFGRANPFVAHAPVGPPLNVWEDDQALYVEADVPGLDPAAFDVTVTEGNQLTIQGERAAPDIKGAVWVRQERPTGRFSRAVSLPVLVDADKVEATYTDGVLRLTLPKHEAAKPRKVQVKTGP